MTDFDELIDDLVKAARDYQRGLEFSDAEKEKHELRKCGYALRAELARVTAERDALIEQIARLGNDPNRR